VPALVAARIAARRVPSSPRLLEAALDVVGLPLEHDEHGAFQVTCL
jgi:hypothetical protein